MMSGVIIRTCIRECFVQPLLLFIVVIGLMACALLAFGVTFHMENGGIVSISLFGGTFREEGRLVAESMARVSFRLISSVMMFLFILMSTPFHSELLRNPLLSIVLTKRLSRPTLLLSRCAGLAVALFVCFISVGLLFSFILSGKTGGQFPTSLLLGTLSIFAECLLLLALGVFLVMLVDHPLGVSVILLALYYVVGPLLADVESGAPGFVGMLAAVFPPIGTLSKATMEIVFDDGTDRRPFLLLIPHSLVSITAAMVLFQRKDLG